MNINWDAWKYSDTFRYLSNYGENILILVTPSSKGLAGLDIAYRAEN